jgi:Dihydrodipicolinate synthase/N-acetylneuraminate lyase
MNPDFKGIYAVVVTPFKEDGSFDYEASKAHLDHMIAAGVQGLCILGATGEYQSVSNKEHMEYVNEIVPYVRDRASVIVGASRERPEDVIELVKNIKASGADAAMVLPSFYCHPSQDEIVEHYRYIMEETDFPIVAYNNPGSAGIEIERDTFKEIFKLKNTAVVKESSGTIQKLTEVLIDAPENVSVFCGCDTLAFESFVDGACGWICMLANFAPEECVKLYELVCIKHDYKAGFELYKKLLPALSLLETFPKPVQAMKYAVTCQGGRGGYVRRPRIELTEEEKAYIRSQVNFDELH